MDAGGDGALVRAVPLLVDRNPPAPAAWPKLSVIVPACNEGAALEAALGSILAQDYPELQIVLIDDRSTDGTAEIVDRMARADRRILAIHIEQLPENWLGKVHALCLGAAKAGGDWLLFTDADVHMAPGALRHALAWAVEQKVDHLAALPDLWPSSLLVDGILSLFCRTFLVVMRLWAVADPKSDVCIGIGAFNLVRREALDRTEGFAWLRMEVGDDLGLGMMLKQAGARCRLVNAHGMLGLHWYRTLGEAAHGARKGLCLCCPLQHGPRRAALPCAGGHGVLAAGRPGILANSRAGLVGRGHARRSRGLFRDSGPLVAGPRAAVAALSPGGFGCGRNHAAERLARWRRGGIVWRGTLYGKAELLAGRRLRI